MSEENPEVMWAYRGMICIENDKILNFNHLECAYIHETYEDNENQKVYVVSLLFRSGTQIHKHYKEKKLADSLLRDLMGFYSVSFETEEKQ
jgi:hypothetical protein